MKKLMTMLSAVALAFGVHAAGTWYSGNSFEDLDVGTNLLETAEGVNWVTNGAATLTVEDITQNRYSVGIRSDYFRDSTIDRALSVKTTFGNPAFRTNSTAKTMGDLYVDTLIKPTICEDDDSIKTLDGAAKIAIWFKEIRNEDDVPTATNLMITAGYFTGTGVVQTNYNCGPIDNADAWQRFTVKSFATVSSTLGEIVPAFVVFRNGVAVTSLDAARCDDGVTTLDKLNVQASVYYKNKALFPSLVQSGAGRQTLSAIGFDGTGLVDDVLFSDDEPTWAAPFKTVTLAWDEHVTGFTYTIGMQNAEVVSGLTGAGSMEIALESGADIVISADTYATDYTRGTFTTSGDGIRVVGDNTFRVTAVADLANNPTANIVSQNDAHNFYVISNGGATTNHYISLDLAIAALNDLSGAVTLKLNADGFTTATGITIDGEDLTSVTIDLNGVTNTVTGTTAESYAITAAVPLTITDTSALQNGAIDAAYTVSSSSSLVINAGTFTGYVTVAAGTAAISGGTFKYNPSAYLAPGYGYEQVGGMYVVGIASYTITYFGDYNEQTEMYDVLELLPDSYTFGDAEIALPTPVKAGYTFAGWTDENGDAFVYVAGETAEDLELYASWTPDAPTTYTVTVAAAPTHTTVAVTTNGAAVAYAASYTVNEGDGVSVTYSADTGYELTVDTSTNIASVTENVAIAAPTVAATSYTVTYNLDLAGATNAVGNIAAYTIETAEFTLLAAGCEGYTFNGWTNALGTAVTAIAGGATGDVTVYASWIKDEPVGPTPIDPASDTPSTVVTAASEEDAIDAAVITAPAGVDAAKYKSNFDFSAVAKGDGTYTVTLTGIKESVKEDVAEDAVAIFSGASGKIAVPDGLYYRISRYTALGTPTETDPVTTGQASGGAGVTVAKPGTTQGFIKVELATKAFN